MVSRRKAHRFSIRSNGHVTDLFHACRWKQSPAADALRNQQGAGLVRLHQVNLEVTGMKQSQSWQSALLLLTVMTFVSFACKKTPAPPPPQPASTGPNSGITPITPPLPAPTVTLRADTSTITRGGTVTLTWESRNA